ncbi:MAG: DUF4398 domain-containing protein [Acidobacteriota bacterium]
MPHDKRLTRLVMAGACLTGAALAGCSSQPVPNDRLAVGRSSIDAAQTAGASEMAPVELNRAREKLAKANEAVQKKDYVLARRLADEADVDAQVARSKANAQRSLRAADEVTAGLRTLRDQMNRSADSGLMPTAPAAGNSDAPGNPPSGMNPQNNPNGPGAPATPR